MLPRRDLELRADLDPVVARTEGVTASFLKELLRRATLAAAEEAPRRSPRTAGTPARIAVDDRHLTCALDDRLDDRHQLTRLTTGGTRPAPAN